MKQITITERNDWEGETFSYILNLNDEEILDFKNGLKNNSNVKIEEDTNFTKDQIKELNNKSSNNYMWRYQFVEFKKPNYDFNWYEDIVYKAVGFTRIK